MRNSKLFLAAACAACLSLCASAANWTITDGIASVTAECELSADDQTTLNGLTSISIASGIRLYAKSGDTVTIPCPINGAGAYSLGKTGTGTLVIANALNSSVTKNTDISFYGAVTFAEGASIGNAYLNIATGDNSESTIVTFDTVFPSGGGPARFQTRGNTAFAFGRANVFANSSSTAIIGRSSNPAGILDLNGYDQTVPTIAFTTPSGQDVIKKYEAVNYFTSDTAAMLTVTKGFSTGSSYTPIFNGRLLGGLSFKLASTTGGTASFSNIFEQVSSTTGSLICASGTIKLLEGARFTSLSSIRKEGEGNFEISTAVINSTVDLYLDGTGTITLNKDITVAHAYTNDTNGGWACLKADDYDESTLGDHLAGTGKVTVLRDDSGSGETVTYTWTGALGNGTLSAGGNWEGGEAPTLDSLGEHLVFPATGTSSCRVDGSIKVGGIEIAYPGAFTVQAGADALIQLGDGGLSVADTTAQTNTVTLAAPISLLSGVHDVMFTVADGTALNIAGGISAPMAYGRRFVIDGGALTFSGASSGLLLPMVVTNATSITVTSPSGLGAAGATLYSIPYFTGTRTCTSPWTLVYSFPFKVETARTLYENVEGSSFEFAGAVRIEGSPEVSEPGTDKILYRGYAVFDVSNDTTFRGGVSCDILSRLQFKIAKNASLYIFDNPIVRGAASDRGTDRVEVRFIGNSATNSFVVTDQSLDSIYQGVYFAHSTLVCAADSCISGVLHPYVNSVDPSRGDPLWSRIDLSGHSQTITRLPEDVNASAQKFPIYPDSFAEVTSGTPATLCFGAKTTYTDLHQLKFTGEASLRTESPWVGTIRITNTVSTTTGDLEITAGTIEFLKDAGWGGGTNVTVNGLSTNAVLRMSAGTRGFSPVGGGVNKVELKLAGRGSLDIPDAGTVVSVRTCETNGVRLSRGDYTAATLPGFVTGSGTLHVRWDHPHGLIFTFR